MNKKLARLIAVGGIVGAAMVPATAAHAVYGNTGGQGGSGDPGSGGAGNGGNGNLPFTGGDVAGLALIGVTLAAGGTALVRVNRRRAAF